MSDSLNNWSIYGYTFLYSSRSINIQYQPLSGNPILEFCCVHFWNKCFFKIYHGSTRLPTTSHPLCACLDWVSNKFQIRFIFQVPFIEPNLCFVQDESGQVFRNVGRVRQLGQVSRVANVLELSSGQIVFTTPTRRCRTTCRRSTCRLFWNVVEEKRRFKVAFFENTTLRILSRVVATRRSDNDTPQIQNEK